MKKNYFKILLMFVVLFTSIKITAQQGPTLYQFTADAQSWVKGYGPGIVGWDNGTSTPASDGALTLDRTEAGVTNNNANIRRGQGGDDTFIVLDADVYNYIKVRVFNQTEAINIQVQGESRAAGTTDTPAKFDAQNNNGVLIAKEAGGFQTAYLDISALTGEITTLDLLFRAGSALTDPTGAKLYIDEIEFLTDVPVSTYSEFIKNPSFDDAVGGYTFKGNTGQLGRELSYDYAKDGDRSFKSTFAKNQDAQFWYFNNFSQPYAAGVITDGKQAKVKMWVRSTRTTPISISVRLKTTNAAGGNSQLSGGGWPTASASTSGTADTWEELTFTIPLPQDHTDPASEIRNIEMWLGYINNEENVALNGVAGDVVYFDQMTAVIEDAATAGVSSQQLENVNMYPNPVENKLFINSKETLNKVEIFNLLGKKVLSTTNTKSIDVSSLSKSVYLVKISSDKGISTKKLVKN
ncbi:T9SS type A sorting domain-containing protein [Polaribacter sp. Q13]|uniref:T9SS type A sorting domain-containing protein n=1 Tax=Polaribacter sp. Q13 TaxID=2806551 RepID=UPI00193C38F6|nr:T9SS type A sorting domain-containing protein [Polaribacter sp. Q13]QVY65644.1 T9SS type A sorting domain-containing protein [Polaribacter sp. Q13]